MHRIIKSYLDAFSEDNLLEQEKESRQFEYFSNYCIVYNKFPSSFDFKDVTNDFIDAGIDGLAFLIDDELATTLDEAKKIFSRPKKNIPVEILFIQAKTSEKYEKGEILKFTTGVEDFFDKNSKLPQGDFLINAKEIINFIISNVAKVKNGRPVCRLYYVCTSNNDIATEIEAVRLAAIKNLNDTLLFSDVSFEYIGLKELMALWDNTNNVTSAILTVERFAPYPNMKGITEAYVSIVSIKNFIEQILLTQEKKMKLNIFEENVRAFLGQDNPVNAKIQKTLTDEEQADKFAIFNNGITIISPDVKVQNNLISMESYQIVNGCQTSNVLYQCKDLDLTNAFVTVKIIEVADPDVISDIVKATNNQTKVDDNQFLAFSPFVRRLEKYFDTTQDIAGQEVKLYFERRLGQYKGVDIPKKKILSITETARALGALFLNKPDLASRYPNKFIAEMAEELFSENNKEEAFYVSALVNYKLKPFYQKNKILNEFAFYKWHIITIFGYLASGSTPPFIQNLKDIKKYSNKLRSICCSDIKLNEIIIKIPAILNDIGLKNNRDEVRSAAYAKLVLEYCNNNLKF